MNNSETKLNKPLIFVTFIIGAYLSATIQFKNIFHMGNEELIKILDEGGLAGIYAKYAFFFTLFIGSFITIFWLKMLWNNLVPRITNWRTINNWESMGIIAILLLLTII